MIRVRAIVAGLAGALAFAAAAHAADPPGTWRPQPMYEKPEQRFTEMLSGWYLRADAGYRWYSGMLTGSGITSERYSNVAAGTLGFGYKYQWFRADLTYDRSLDTTVQASTTAATPQPQYTGRIRAETALANAYIDFGTWGGFTPYIGAGAGITRLKSIAFYDSILPPVSPITTGDAKSEHFAWALMAGVSVQVAPQWHVDVGFRQLHLGEVASSETPGFRTNAPEFRDLVTREVRVGIRFLLD